MSIDVFILMILFIFATSVTPGPNNMMLLVSGVNFGFRRTIPHLWGIIVGLFVMIFLVGFGLETLFDQFPVLMKIIKFLGLLYIFILAWKIARSPISFESETEIGSPLGFAGAFIFQWVNPKAWMMSISFVGTYFPHHASLAFIIVGSLIFSVFSLPSIVIWIVLGTQIKIVLRQEKYQKAFNYLMAFLLVVSIIPVALYV